MRRLHRRFQTSFEYRSLASSLDTAHQPLAVALRSTTFHDLLFIALIITLSCVLYIGGLGFYSDDWSFLGYLVTADDQSLPGLFSAIYGPHVEMRPVQVFYLSSHYWLFGTNPTGYHLVNAVVLIAAAWLLYAVCRRLTLPRPLALGVALVWALLPHYATDRFWYSAFQINLSMAFFLAGLLADLRGLSCAGPRAWLWKAASIVALVIAALAYEIVLPLFLLIPVLAWFQSRRLSPERAPGRLMLLVWTGATLGAVVAVAVFKQATTVRQGDSGLDFYRHLLRNALRLDFGHYEYGLNIKQASLLNLGDLGVGLPFIAWQAARDHASPQIVVLSALIGVLVYAYLQRTVTTASAGAALQRGSLALLIAAPIVFGLGYAIFLTNYNVQYALTGVGNRTAIGAAVGVALLIVGLAGLVASRLPRAAGRHTLPAVTGLVCMCGVLVINTVAVFWIDSWTEQQDILAAIERYDAAPATGSSLLLDGSCPYLGPAIVFESSWDLAGALWVRHGDTTIGANIVSSTLRVEDDAIVTVLYNTEYRHPYGAGLSIFNASTQQTYLIPDRVVADKYFATAPTNAKSCPAGREGHGVEIFERLLRR